MRKYYTRPCNFYYGNCARRLIKKKRAFSLTGNPNIAFDRLEIFKRKKKGVIETNSYSIFEIKSLNKEKKTVIKTDLKKITSKRKKISGLKFNSPQIIGVLNVTPDSFSDGGLFFEESKAFDQVNLMIVFFILSHSSFSLTVFEPGLVDSPPTSIIVAPLLIIRLA